jgi:hypothetical protein
MAVEFVMRRNLDEVVQGRGKSPGQVGASHAAIPSSSALARDVARAAKASHSPRLIGTE